jgi:hypothetical protein
MEQPQVLAVACAACPQVDARDEPVFASFLRKRAKNLLFLKKKKQKDFYFLRLRRLRA